VYNVHYMKHLKVAEARARFGEILDEAEKGATVIIERRDVRFRLVAEPQQPSDTPKAALFDFVDPAVMTGQWTWKVTSKGVTFASRRKRR
jgi:antitoxin (DNA-binding transcriptional repressor) of toxin-antitoxin stability system